MRSGALRLVVLLSSAVGLACGLVAADASADTVTSKLVASGNAFVPSIATAQWVAETHGVGAAGGTHTYTRSGIYTVKLTVRDDDGGSQQQSLVIAVGR
jgi:hypothetical protein